MDSNPIVAFALDRSLISDLPLFASLTPEALVDSARAGIAEGLLAGITTYADTNESGATTSSDALLVLRLAVGQQVTLACPACA